MKKNRLGKEHLKDRALSRFPFLEDELKTRVLEPRKQGRKGVK